MKRIKKGVFKYIIVFMTFLMCNITIMGHLGNVAYADESIEEPCLSKLYISEGNNIDFKKDEYVYIVDVLDIDEDIYIEAKPDEDYYKVKINGKELNKDDKYEYDTQLKEGKNKFEIRVTDDKNSSETIYTVYIFRGGKEAVYLKNLKIDGKNFGFDKKRTIYSIELDEDTKYIELEAETEDDSYSLYINDTPMNKYKEISFKQPVGMYELKVTVKDNETNRSIDYHLDLYLGMPVTPNVNDVLDNYNKKNQWLIMNGRWKYKDSKGEYLKDSWLYDKNYGKYFYFDSKGNMKTGWITYKGKEYYLESDGGRLTGWLDYDDAWYYFGSDGAMKTDWIEDNSKWYYLDDDGIMQTGWIKIGEDYYYLNNDGTMKTGWIKDEETDKWRYLNDDGKLAKGRWVRYEDNWYYINFNGTMRTGWLYKDDKYYYLNDDGTMQIEAKLIDDYYYNFYADGSVNFN